MTLPNLSTLRCCPSSTGTILTRPVSTDVCPVCHAPPFGCAGTAPGSEEDDWRRCAPEQWRMRPNDGDGAPMTVAVMRRCNALVHVSCLQGWVDAKRAADPRRATYPCPACAGTECVSPELLADMGRAVAAPSTRTERWNAVKARIMRSLDPLARICEGYWFDLTAMIGSTMPIMDDAQRWLTTANAAPLRAPFKKRYDEGVRQLLLLVVRPYQNAAIGMQNLYGNHRGDPLSVRYWDARDALVAHVPLVDGLPFVVPDMASTVLERAEAFADHWEPQLQRQQRHGQRIRAQIREVLDHAPNRLRDLQDLRRRLDEEQRRSDEAEDFYQLMRETTL